MLDRYIFSIFIEPITAFQETPPIRTRLLASFYGGIGGMTFGWLYWKKGLEAAMMSHFTTGIVLHPILPSLV